jgi:hypothetical protein
MFILHCCIFIVSFLVVCCSIIRIICNKTYQSMVLYSVIHIKLDPKSKHCTDRIMLKRLQLPIISRSNIPWPLLAMHCFTAMACAYTPAGQAFRFWIHYYIQVKLWQTTL